MPEIIRNFGHDIPKLGICLGHQAIGECYRAKLVQLPGVLHGVQREITITDRNDRLFAGLTDKLLSGHYHSWVLSGDAWPDELTLTATGPHGTVMALSHTRYPLSGVQFHPESVMTPDGMKIMENWLRFCG
jgi:anthranilate synthase/aminodeoxychorismate synthase-like glutamine amidotransferase